MKQFYSTPLARLVDSASRCVACVRTESTRKTANRARGKESIKLIEITLYLARYWHEVNEWKCSRRVQWNKKIPLSGSSAYKVARVDLSDVERRWKHLPHRMQWLQGKKLHLHWNTSLVTRWKDSESEKERSRDERLIILSSDRWCSVDFFSGSQWLQ